MWNQMRRGIATCCLLGLVFSAPAAAQDDEPSYAIVDCMKSTSSHYADIEVDVWKPLHQEMVNRGQKMSWAFYWVLYGDRSACDYYTVNIFTRSQLNAYAGVTPDLFDSVHTGKDMEKMMTKTAASREMGRTEQWEIVDLIQPVDFNYVQVNQMSTNDALAYVEMEQQVYKPVHEAMIADGATAGWGLYRLVSPHGSGIGYNYGTADFLHTLGGIDFNTWLGRVHPDKDLSELGDQVDYLRDFVKGDTWTLIDRTAQPPE